jgi:hypothetical protein
MLYRLPVQVLAFLPEGECSVSYRVRCSWGRDYFLKLWGDNRQGRPVRDRLDEILPVVHELFTRELVANLPAPIPAASGALWAGFGEYALALYPFLEGQPISLDTAQVPAGVTWQIAETMAGLHRAAPLLSAPLPRRSAFEIGFIPEMRRGLAELSSIGPRRPPAHLRLRSALLPVQEGLLAELGRLLRLREQAISAAPQLVLCHTDMGGNNVLVDPGGRVSILDWDDLILAPPEQDLHEYRGEGFAGFLSLYRQAGGVPGLSLLQFEFYLLRRYLADLADWLLRILYAGNSPEQDESDLAGIQTYCLPALANFAHEMAGIARAIDVAGMGRKIG